MSQDTTQQIHLPATIWFAFGCGLLIAYGFLYTKYSDNNKILKKIKIILIITEIIGTGVSVFWYYTRLV